MKTNQRITWRGIDVTRAYAMAASMQAKGLTCWVERRGTSVVVIVEN